MAIKCMTAVWEIKGLTPSQKLLLLALADHAGDDYVCWPSMPRLAKRSDMSVRNVRRIIHQLNDLGFIEIINLGLGRGNKTTYRVHPSPMEKCDTQGTKGDKLSPNPKPINGDTQGLKEDTDGTKGDTQGLKGDKRSHTHGEPLEPPIEPSGNREGSLAPVREANPKAKPEQQPTTRPQPSGMPKINMERYRAAQEAWKQAQSPPAPSQSKSSVIKIDSPYLPKGLQLPGRHIPAGTGDNAVQVYYERFDVTNPDERLNALQEDDLVRICPDLERLREVVIAYSRNGQYKPRNVQLILDWYRAGIPNKHRRNSRGTYQQNGNGNDRREPSERAGGDKPADVEPYTAEEIEQIRRFRRPVPKPVPAPARAIAYA